MQITTIGLDLAKHVFQVHGVDAAGQVAIRRKLRRSEIAEFFANLPRCRVGIEACATAHQGARGPSLSRRGRHALGHASWSDHHNRQHRGCQIRTRRRRESDDGAGGRSDVCGQACRTQPRAGVQIQGASVRVVAGAPALGAPPPTGNRLLRAHCAARECARLKAHHFDRQLRPRRHHIGPKPPLFRKMRFIVSSVSLQ
jgi:hypothetical protein